MPHRVLFGLVRSTIFDYYLPKATSGASQHIIIESPLNNARNASVKVLKDPQVFFFSPHCHTLTLTSLIMVQKVMLIYI
jgi:hypothetical protein